MNKLEQVIGPTVHITFDYFCQTSLLSIVWILYNHNKAMKFDIAHHINDVQILNSRVDP